MRCGVEDIRGIIVFDGAYENDNPSLTMHMKILFAALTAFAFAFIFAITFSLPAQPSAPGASALQGRAA